MANAEQLEILTQGVQVWNRWREKHADLAIDLLGADLTKANLVGANLLQADLRNAKLDGCRISNVNLVNANLWGASLLYANLVAACLRGADMSGAELRNAQLQGADLSRSILWGAKLTSANLQDVNLYQANLGSADLKDTNLSGADLQEADLRASDLSGVMLHRAKLRGCNVTKATAVNTQFTSIDLGDVKGLGEIIHLGPSVISTDVFSLTRKILPIQFLRGCGLSDWEIVSTFLYNPNLNNQQINDIQYKMYDLRATRAIQVSHLFISYSHADAEFVNKLGKCLDEKGIRYWRDIHDMIAGPIETQIDRAIKQNPTVLVILSRNSLRSDWVEHEVRAARQTAKELERHVLCPVALDDAWRDSHWPERIMEQIMEYNILDFSGWQDDRKFDKTFRELIDGLELFYKGDVEKKG